MAAHRPTPGFEPGPAGWKAGTLTTILTRTMHHLLYHIFPLIVFALLWLVILFYTYFIIGSNALSKFYIRRISLRTMLR